MTVEVQDQLVYQTLRRQLHSKQPDRPGIGRLALGREARETAKAETITYLVLQLLVGEVAQVLEYQWLEHHSRVEGFVSRPAFSGGAGHFVQGGTIVLPVARLIEKNQRITRIQLFVALAEIEGAGLRETAYLILSLDDQILPDIGRILEVPF